MNSKLDDYLAQEDNYVWKKVSGLEESVHKAFIGFGELNMYNRVGSVIFKDIEEFFNNLDGEYLENEK